MSARWTWGATAVFILCAATLGAQPVSFPDHAWTLRGNFGINTPSDPLPGDAFLALSVTRRLVSRLGVEVFLGPGLPVTTLAKDGHGGTRKVDLGSGLHGAALLRLEHKLTSSGRSLLSLAGGPSFVSGDVFGTVPMARVDVGFDWRFAPTALASLTMGYESVLSTSRQPFDAPDCLHAFDCPPHYKAGKGQVSARWGIGFTF
jgi:hypothetical protein